MLPSKFQVKRSSTAGHPLLCAAVATLLGCALSPLALAQATTFASTNVQYLSGSDYEVVFFDPALGRLSSYQDSRSVMTIEHVNEWAYGDNFLFIDVTNPDRNSSTTPTNYYGEFAPRFSFGKVAGWDLSAGLIKDVLLTTTLEIGQGFRNNLYGVAVDLNLPGTPVFQINYYARNEIAAGADRGSQVTLVWLKPFTIGSAAFVFEGFFDYAWGMDHKEDNIITAPRVMFDLSNVWDVPGALQVGVEYQMWRNKFGIDGIDEDVPQIMMKWTF